MDIKLKVLLDDLKESANDIIARDDSIVEDEIIEEMIMELVTAIIVTQAGCNHTIEDRLIVALSAVAIFTMDEDLQEALQ